MKHLITLLGILCLSAGLNSCTQDPIKDDPDIGPPQTRASMLDDADYYWHRGTQVAINIIPNKKYVLLDGTSEALTRNITDVEFIETPNLVTLSGNIKPMTSTDALSRTSHEQKSLSWAIVKTSSVSNLPNVIYEAPCYTSTSGNELALSHLFYVKLKSENDEDKLQTLADESNVEILGNNEYMPLWYTLSCSNTSDGNALEMANLFYESGLFQSCQPSFVCTEDDTTDVPNDPLFPTQWALSNTGQYSDGVIGMDINCLAAHTITQGDSNIVVAVLDHGTQLNHPDLNIYSKSYDTETGTSPSVIHGDHGTACSGIISAKANNGIGITGIAPNCPVMSISNMLVGSSDAAQKRADGFNYAWTNGAAVISNSWRASSYSELLEDAIQTAISQGRNGLGCVVVFSAGNDNLSTVGYPARSLPDILTAGAMSYDGMRKSPQSADGEYWWGSNFGDALDVVAPGVKIQTTDRTGSAGYNNVGDYTPSFNGTSSACPHVAAVAALVLSACPSLTQRDVCDIIEGTARKLPAYTYNTVSGRSNGSWNVETGYGLIDAYTAVAVALAFIDPDLYLEDKIFAMPATFSAEGWIYIDNVTVNSGSRLDLNAGVGVEITDSFEVSANATLIIQQG